MAASWDLDGLAPILPGEVAGRARRDHVATHGRGVGPAEPSERPVACGLRSRPVAPPLDFFRAWGSRRRVFRLRGGWVGWVWRFGIHHHCWDWPGAVRPRIYRRDPARRPCGSEPCGLGRFCCSTGRLRHQGAVGHPVARVAAQHSLSVSHRDRRWSNLGAPLGQARRGFAQCLLLKCPRWLGKAKHRLAQPVSRAPRPRFRRHGPSRGRVVRGRGYRGEPRGAYVRRPGASTPTV